MIIKSKKKSPNTECCETTNFDTNVTTIADENSATVVTPSSMDKFKNCIAEFAKNNQTTIIDDITYDIDNDGTVCSKEVTAPNGKNVYLSITYPSSVSYKKDVIVAISGTTITPQTYSTITFRSGQSPTIANSTNYIYITKVLGFKY